MMHVRMAYCTFLRLTAKTKQTYFLHISLFGITTMSYFVIINFVSSVYGKGNSLFFYKLGFNEIRRKQWLICKYYHFNTHSNTSEDKSSMCQQNMRVLYVFFFKWSQLVLTLTKGNCSASSLQRRRHFVTHLGTVLSGQTLPSGSWTRHVEGLYLQRAADH